jgi:hypothetical protein
MLEVQELRERIAQMSPGQDAIAWVSTLSEHCDRIEEAVARRREPRSYNALSFAQAERLHLLAEECAEVIQAVTKILRHGYESGHPDALDPETSTYSPTNLESLLAEIGHVEAAIELLDEAEDLGNMSALVMDAACGSKRENVRRYLHHQEG